MFCLPQFSDRGLHHSLEFSLSLTTFTELDETFGISVEKINNHLSMSWLKAALRAGNRKTVLQDYAGICLAEYDSRWSRDVGPHFYFKFGPPQVKVLCNQEVVVYFNIEEARFYESEGYDL